MKQTIFVLTVLVSLACLSIDARLLSAMQTKEPKLPTETMKLIRLKALRLSKVKRVKGGGLTAIFVPTGTLQFAQIGVTCPGGREFSLSTGNNEGTCSVTTKDDGKTITGATCTDTSNPTPTSNSATVSCSTGQGGSCTSTSGSGTCN